MISEIEFKKLVWHSRRGMLELDVLLGPFTQDHFKQLPENLQAAYVDMLEEEDADLWAWLQGTLATPNEHYAQLVKLVNEKVGAGQAR